jgi:hypothetical protein
MLVICWVGWVGIADDNIDPKSPEERTKLTEEDRQFVVRMKLTEEGKDHPLSSPMIMVHTDQPASIDIRSRHDFRGRTLPIGFTRHLTVHPLDDKHVMLHGDLEKSYASDTSDEIVYRTIHSLHFHCRVELGESHEIKLNGPCGSPQVVSFLAESCNSQDPEKCE